MQRLLAALILSISVLAPLVASAQITADLRYGSKGAQVKELQQFLIDQNILVGTPTGNFYIITQKAVKIFQGSAGLPQTGFVGPMTRAEINVRLLGMKTATSTPKVADLVATTTNGVAEISAQVQALLKALGSPSATTSIPQTYAQSSTPFEFEQQWRNAVVNLFCTDRYGGGLSSGSGVIIDPRGIILTNAHVALDFLFSEWPTPSVTECVVRTGSPASPVYKAKLMYIPAGYIKDTVSAVPGAGDDSFVYGKDDYALLAITGPSSAQVTMPASFPYLSIQFAPPPVNTPVYLLGYASEYTSYEMLQRSLYQLASPANVNSQRQLQGSRQVDAIAFNGNVVGQHGSSGGAVILKGGQLAGLMTFFDKNAGLTTGDKVLNAITTGYIARDFEIDRAQSFATWLTLDPTTVANNFMATDGALYQKFFVAYWKARGIIVPGLNE